MSVQGTLRSLRLPALQCNVLDLNFFQDFEIGREVRDFIPFVRVFVSDFDLVKPVKDVEFCEIDRSVPVDLIGVAELDCVKPATAAFTTGGSAAFVARFLELCADFLMSVKKRDIVR